MLQQRANFVFLNVGHFLDHLFMLVFATVAALRLADEWGMSYAALIPYATPGFVAFGLCAVPAGWIADKWSRRGMMAIFFIGIGFSAIATSYAETPLQIGIGLLFIGVFAAIYHPVGLAMVVHGRVKTGLPLAINGVFGNIGVACAALLTGLFIDQLDWRSAFAVPGLLSVFIGLMYLAVVRSDLEESSASTVEMRDGAASHGNGHLLRIFGIVFVTTAIGGLIFQSMTFALPKVFDERLQGLAETASEVGGYASAVFMLAALAQLVVGYLIDNHSVRSIFALVAALQVGFFTLMVQLDGVASLLVATGFMTVVFGQIPINDVLVGRVSRSEWRARIYALKYTVTFTVMALAVPVIAWVHSTWGFDALFAIMAVAASLIFIAVLLLPSHDVVVRTASQSGL